MLLYHETVNMWTKGSANLLVILHISTEILCYVSKLINACKDLKLAYHIPLTQCNIGHTSDAILSCILIFWSYDEIQNNIAHIIYFRKTSKPSTRTAYIEMCPRAHTTKTTGLLRSWKNTPTAIRMTLSKL